MTTSHKQALLTYLEFLKSSGYLYHEGPALEMAAVAQAPVSPAAPSQPRATSKPASKPRTQAKQEAAPVQSPPPQPKVIDMPSEPLPRAQRLERIETAMATAEACRACPLGATRNKLVYGDGDCESKLMFVGEAPGGEEDKTGIPFVGRAGKLLTKMIAAIGFEREEVYICNTLKCRPPNNRDPKPEEKAACEHFLVEQLAIIRPKVIVALGAHAAQYLCRSELAIGKLRNQWYDYHGTPLYVTYHPAFLLRSPSMKSKAWEDFQAIHAKYSELAPDDNRKIWQKE